MEFSTEDLDRLFLFEHTRKIAEVEYAKNPLDAENLVKWGGSLLELSQFQSLPDAKVMIIDAIAKLDEALKINPANHEALWCMGNAYTSSAFLIQNFDEAKDYLTKATGCFERAVAEDPGNEAYRKSLEMTAKAPELHMEIHRQGLAQQAAPGGSFASSSSKNPKKKKADSDFKYDIFGWVILAVGLVAWVGMAKSVGPPLPPPPPR